MWFAKKKEHRKNMRHDGGDQSIRTGRRFLDSQGHLAIGWWRKLRHVLDFLGAETKTALVGISNTANSARNSRYFAAICGPEKKRKT
jgi:hypothetical protein